MAAAHQPGRFALGGARPRSRQCLKEHPEDFRQDDGSRADLAGSEFAVSDQFENLRASKARSFGDVINAQADLVDHEKRSARIPPGP